ncbi:MAG: hypothetical protein LBQ50_07180 [Planctomycetaceae bacterium]|jgi:hypothetical protein|nr:hypothetical protein [Planctomycetaceae bacterium]
MSRNCFVTSLFFVIFVGCHVVLSFGETIFKVNRSESLYGKGVHAFFDKNYSEAVDLLTQTEQLGSEDPRPYYFLALAHLRLKQDGKAENYFKKAARLEWEGQSARDYQVSEALRRIQGYERVDIERYRTQAKSDWQNAEKRKRDVLYANEKAEEKRILTEMAKHPVAVVDFGARSIDPLGTGKKIEEISTANVSGASTDTGKTSEDKKNQNQQKDDPFAGSDDENNKNSIDKKEEKDKKEETDEDDPFGGSDNMNSENKEVAVPDDSDGDSKKDENKKDEKEESEDDDPFK